MIIDTLQLPELVFPLTTITVGYPDGIPAQVDRLPLEAAVHEEKYHDYTPEEIDKLYAYKESLPENKQFIEENKKKLWLKSLQTCVIQRKITNLCLKIYWTYSADRDS